MAKSYIENYEPAMKKAQELCKKAGAKTQSEKYAAVTKWLSKSIGYDYVRAAHIKDVAGPDVKRCYEKRIGICADIACLTCCMLRAVGVRANVAIGMATLNRATNTDNTAKRVTPVSSSWHAWVEAYVDGKKLLYDQMVEHRNIGKTKNRYSATYRVYYVRK